MPKRIRSITLLASALSLVLGAGTPARADDAKKQALAQAKLEAELKQCATAYSNALAQCEKLADASACYVNADTTDRACRQALGAVGQSTVPSTQLALLKPDLRVSKIRKPLGCTGGPITAVVCADGHARKPDPCIELVPGVNGGTDRNPVAPTVDGDGTKDTCTGRLPVRCPAGFVQIPRKGEDLCWDSAQNASLYQY